MFWNSTILKSDYSSRIIQPYQQFDYFFFLFLSTQQHSKTFHSYPPLQVEVKKNQNTFTRQIESYIQTSSFRFFFIFHVENEDIAVHSYRDLQTRRNVIQSIQTSKLHRIYFHHPKPPKFSKRMTQHKFAEEIAWS